MIQVSFNTCCLLLKLKVYQHQGWLITSSTQDKVIFTL